MARPEFAVELRTAIHRARKQDVPVRKDGILINRNGRLSEVSLQVVPISGGPGEGGAAERYFLILFEEARAPRQGSQNPSPPPATPPHPEAFEIPRWGVDFQPT